MKSPVKKILAVAVAALGLVAVADPGVTVNEVTENGTWSKVDVKYTLSGVDASASYKVAFDVTADGATAGVTNDAAKLESTSYTQTIDTKDLFGTAKRDAKAKVKVSLIPGFTPDVPVPDAVQLWADGPYFATFNVGASKPEEYGYYFWWGDTVGYKRSGSSWVSVKDGSSFSFSSSNSKIVTYDKSIAELYSAGYIDANSSSGKLKPAYDAARAHLGAPWRMMTKDELDKLVSTDYCQREWVTKYKGVTVNGYVVKGKAGSAYANNEVFFPAAGYGSGSSLYNSGSDGRYWSSTPRSNSCSAWGLYFGSSDFYAYYYSRYYGFPVRPVRGFAE